ncbi:hypothetical protein NDU88_002353 [Pleurodeles waltl]|uniref:Uncharacterized protein n=1 Tax=Pleurodeles waltl TaxID=8319 RepID=A0AAV7KSL5_PLEWA|nr:hypothetical protein NDU88_002353 [Pleurodeles waltl]
MITSATAILGQQEKEIRELSSDLACLEMQHVALVQASQAGNEIQQGTILKAKISGYYSEILERKFQVHKSEAYEYRHSVGRMLTFRIREYEVDQAIEVIERGNSTRATTPENITKGFQGYYTKLYMGDVQPAEEQVNEFL